jgi:hypothetical protein
MWAVEDWVSAPEAPLEEQLLSADYSVAVAAAVEELEYASFLR